MKKKLLVLLIAVIPTLMPNLASAIEIEWESLVISYRVPLPPLGLIDNEFDYQACVDFSATQQNHDCDYMWEESKRKDIEFKR